MKSKTYFHYGIKGKEHTFAHIFSVYTHRMIKYVLKSVEMQNKMN